MPIPSSGFLRIYPQTASIISGEFSIAGTGVGSASALANQAAIEAYYLTRVDNPAVSPRLRFIDEVPPAGGTFVPAAGTYELQFSPNTSRLVFDPTGTPTEIDILSSDFPMGLTLSQLRIHLDGAYLAGLPSRNRLLTDISLKYFGSTVFSLTPTPSGALISGAIASSGVFDIIPFLSSWSIIQVLKQFGFSATMSSAVAVPLDQPRLSADLCYIQCVYNTLQFVITTTTPMVSPGSVANITASTANLDVFDSFKVYWVDPDGDASDFIDGLAGGITLTEDLILELTETTLIFLVPDEVPYGGWEVILVGIPDGTLFTGEFPLQNYNTQLVEGSGVYKLVEGQAYDTYYDRSVTPSTTVNLKIPDPRVKTGFFP